jgi:hypothetical protein
VGTNYRPGEGGEAVFVRRKLPCLRVVLLVRHVQKSAESYKWRL